MKRRRTIYEGKAKILYEGPEPGTLVQYFKDDTTAFDAKKKAVIEGKGVLNNRISEYLMTQLNGDRRADPFHQAAQHARAADPAGRDHSARGRGAQRRGGLAVDAARHRRRHAAAALDHRVLLQERRAPRSDGLRGAHHRLRLGDARRISTTSSTSRSASTTSCPGLFLGVGIKLVDFKLEFGRLWENDFMRIVLADEISPDSCRLWDIQTNEKLDKDRFRRDLGGVTEAYSEVARRLGILPESIQASRATGPVLVEMKARVFVTLKNGVLDPQGKAIGHALNSLGFGRSARCARAR